MVAAITAVRPAQPLPCSVREGAQFGGRDFGVDALQGDAGAFRVHLGLSFQRPQLGDAFLERLVADIGDAALDRVVESFQPNLGLGRLLAQFDRVGRPALGPLLAAIKNDAQDLFQPFGIKQPLFQMGGDQIVQPFHWDRASLASDGTLPGGDRAGVVAIAPGLAGTDGHGAAAVGAETDAGQHGGAAHDLGRRDLGIARFEVRLHRIERFLVDQRWNGDSDHLVQRLEGLGLAPLVELVAADIGRPCQHPMDRADTPAPTCAGVKLAFVEVLGDRLDAHAAGHAVAFERKPEGQAHRVGMERVYLQLLLDLGAALLRIDHAIADRRQRAVPEPLTCVLLQGPARVLSRFLGLVFIEQRHDLAHHGVHGIVAELLGHRDEPHAVLGQLPDVELKLEMVAEEAAERMDDHHIEGGGLGGARLDHLLELGAAVVGGRCAGLHIGFDKLIAA